MTNTTVKHKRRRILLVTAFANLLALKRSVTLPLMTDLLTNLLKVTKQRNLHSNGELFTSLPAASHFNNISTECTMLGLLELYLEVPGLQLCLPITCLVTKLNTFINVV